MLPDLRKVLAAHPKAKAQWDDLTPIARRDFLSWIESAKQAETRTRRVESLPSRLASGKRRPCCFVIVPMNIYKALNTNPKAKAMWKELSADEKRDYAAWVESPKTADERTQRVAKALVQIMAGKRRP